MKHCETTCKTIGRNASPNGSKFNTCSKIVQKTYLIFNVVALPSWEHCTLPFWYHCVTVCFHLGSAVRFHFGTMGKHMSSKRRFKLVPKLCNPIQALIDCFCSIMLEMKSQRSQPLTKRLIRSTSSASTCQSMISSYDIHKHKDMRCIESRGGPN